MNKVKIILKIIEVKLRPKEKNDTKLFRFLHKKFKFFDFFKRRKACSECLIKDCAKIIANPFSLDFDIA